MRKEHWHNEKGGGVNLQGSDPMAERVGAKKQHRLCHGCEDLLLKIPDTPQVFLCASARSDCGITAVGVSGVHVGVFSLSLSPGPAVLLHPHPPPCGKLLQMFRPLCEHLKART